MINGQDSQKESRSVRKPRIDRGVTRLTERDLTLLTWIGQQYAVRIDTLRVLIGRTPDKRSSKEAHPNTTVTERNVRRIIKRWQDAGFVKYQKFLYDEPGVVWLTTRGLTSVGLDYRLYTPTAFQLAHLHVLNELRLRLEERYGQRLEWKPERTLRREHEQLPDEARAYRHLADAEVVIDGNAPHAIEVELTRKSDQRLQEIIYKLERQYAGVWYFVNETTKQAVEKAIGPNSQTFRVYAIAEIIPC